MNQQIENSFIFPSPNEEQFARFSKICTQAEELTYMIYANLTSSRERLLALTKLEECMMWVNVGITRNEVSNEQ